MQDRIKNIVFPIEIAIIVLGILLYMLIRNPLDYSDSERRVLVQKPELTLENVLSTKYMTGFEEYALDQFPFRDSFRTVKALSSKYIFAKKDNNKIFELNGYVSKLEYPLNYPMLEHAVDRFQFINKTYLEKNGIVPSIVIVPEKNYYLIKDSSYLSLDYDKLYDYMFQNTNYMNHIDIRDDLSIEDYYYTDTHWRQNKLEKVAKKIISEMNTDDSIVNAISNAAYEEREVELEFKGVYFGQSALPLKADRITYLTNETIENCMVKNYDTGKAVDTKVYNFEKAYGKDAYEMFLDGSTAIITIENPKAKSDKQLIIFRDSFGSSLAPLFIEGYSKITLIDIRYVQTSMLSAFVDFENADVLFEYSTLLLNNSLGLK